MKTVLGLDLKRSFWYELSSMKAYLARRHSGAADRFAHSAGPGSNTPWDKGLAKYNIIISDY